MRTLALTIWTGVIFFLVVTAFLGSPIVAPLVLAGLFIFYGTLVFRKGTRASTIHEPDRLAPWLILSLGVGGFLLASHYRFEIPSYATNAPLGSLKEAPLRLNGLTLDLSEEEVLKLKGAPKKLDLSHFLYPAYLDGPGLGQAVKLLIDRAEHEAVELVVELPEGVPLASLLGGQTESKQHMIAPLIDSNSAFRVVATEQTLSRDLTSEALEMLLSIHAKPQDLNPPLFLFINLSQEESPVGLFLGDTPRKMLEYENATVLIGKSGRVEMILGTDLTLGSKTWISSGQTLARVNRPGPAAKPTSEQMKAIFSGIYPDFSKEWYGEEIYFWVDQDVVESIQLGL